MISSYRLHLMIALQAAQSSGFTQYAAALAELLREEGAQ